VGEVVLPTGTPAGRPRRVDACDAVALQPPAGPVFVSIPFGDWAQPARGTAVVRGVSHRVAPDPDRVTEFGERINSARRPALVFGAEVDRADGWQAGVAFAEKLGAPVYGGPLPDRVSFPENHTLYAGQLPMTIAGASDTLLGHDLVVVIGAQVFRYYAYVAGTYVPEGTELLHITADPGRAGAAPSVTACWVTPGWHSNAFLRSSMRGPPRSSITRVPSPTPQCRTTLR
jgi:benzoylformate decarboxylase